VMLKDDKGNEILMWNRDTLNAWSDRAIERLLEDASDRELDAIADWKALRAEQVRRENND